MTLNANANAIVVIEAPALARLVGKSDNENVHLCRQLALFQCWIFIKKSEECSLFPNLELGMPSEDFVGVSDTVPALTGRVADSERDNKSGRGQDSAGASSLFF